jgi:DNA-binding Lrp family transcriptional regulator
MLNSLDRQLILALQRNGRATNVELGRQLGVHVSTIAKRIESLEENEIMKVRALPNPSKLGYTVHSVIAIKANIHNNEAICSRLNKNFHVNFLVTAFGRYDILAIVYFPNWEKLLNLVSSELSDMDGLKVDTFLVKEIKKRHFGLMVDNVKSVKVDEIDQKIIEKLTENGRYKSQWLAKDLGISPPTCLRRISRLLNEKVIEIKAVPNPSKIGFAANAFMFLQVQVAKLEEVCATLRLYENIYLIMTLINSYNVLISFNSTTPEELYKFQNKILSIEGIIDGDIIIRAEIRKRYYGRPLNWSLTGTLV